MKTIVAFALFIACVAQIQCVSYKSCGENLYYTEEFPRGYQVEVAYNPYPYRHAGLLHGYGSDCDCPRCSPRLFTQ
uniref:Uncharacterized protein n=1 Tax=Anopheles epiroticus TaxID=199890 RepID=A0A182PWX3_9DIPT